MLNKKSDEVKMLNKTLKLIAQDNLAYRYLMLNNYNLSFDISLINSAVSFHIKNIINPAKQAIK